MAKPPVNWNNVSSLTPGMKNLGNQLNRRFPNRAGDSDGAWGDYEHTQHKSGHNPDDTSGSKPSWEDADNVPDIRSIDVDNTLNDSEVNMQDVIDHTRKLPNLKSVIRYMIYDHYMYHQDDNYNPTPYTGSSPHTEHAHFEGAFSESADQNTTFDFQFDKLGSPEMLPIPKGAVSEDVKYIQYLLNEVGYSVGKVDGSYGDSTQKAVDAHRAAHGQGPNPSVTAWQYFKLHEDLAKKNAGKDGLNGINGKDGEPGPPGVCTGTFQITGGTMTAESI